MQANPIANSIEDFAARCERVRQEMYFRSVDCLLVGPSPDLIYLTGYAARQSERLTMFILPRYGTPHLLMPNFELPRVEKLATWFEPVGWVETEDPLARLESLLPETPRELTIAVGNQLFSQFLIRIQKRIRRATYVAGEEIVGPVRIRKSRSEVEQLRTASRYADTTFEAILQSSLLEMSERAILARIHRLLIEKGHDSVAGGIVAVGANTASPHHSVSDIKPNQGDSVILDYVGIAKNYYSDFTRTLYVGSPPDEFRRVYDIVNIANQKAFEAIRPGAIAEEIDAVAREYIRAAGYGDQFIHRTGHGIGLEVHEPPYLLAGNRTVLEEGMTFSIEPGIYLPGKFGVRIEDIVVVTANGAERLNQATHELQIVE